MKKIDKKRAVNISFKSLPLYKFILHKANSIPKFFLNGIKFAIRLFNRFVKVKFYTADV